MKKSSGFIYFIFGIYTLLISWHYNHSFLWLLVHYAIWPLYLLYQILTGHLAHGLWKSIPASYFN